MPKILVVGFDGATWDLINPLVEQGILYTFKKLMKESAWGHMKSTIPPMTIPAWVSMFSGLAPETLCMFDFMKLTIKDNRIHSRLYSSHDFKGRLLWDLVSQKGITSLVLNIPGTYPPYPIRGHLIGLELTPLESCTYPEELEDILNKEHDLAKIKELQTHLHKGESYALSITEAEEKKILEIVTSFSRTFSYDIIFVRFGIPDHVSHYSIKDEAMKKCHLLMDTMLNHILHTIEYDYVILVSDHGIKKEDTVFYINRLLEEVGVLKTNLMNTVVTTPASIFSELMGETLTKTLYKKIFGLKERLDPQTRSSFVTEKLNMDKTTAFAYSAGPSHFCPLYITRPEVKDRVVEILKGADTYIRDIHVLNCGPSALVESYYAMSPLTIFKKKLAKKIHWVHSLRGLFLIQGPGIKKGTHVDCTICDITPTILHILGLPIPDDLDGRVMTELFEESSEMKRKPEYVDITYYKTEKEKLDDSIKKLKRQKNL